jgi:peptidoglycan/LPS O-acetylase OafA/YrhL
LTIEWRSRIAVSTLIALLLAVRGAHRTTKPGALTDTIAFLSRISFPLFVLHYPVLMLVGSLVKIGWGDAALPSAIGLVVAWGLAMAAAHGLACWLEARNGG